MTEERNQKSTKEIVFSNMLSIETLIRVLEKKGIITQVDILEELRQFNLEQEAQRN